MDLNQRFQGISTIVLAEGKNRTELGTGFFYQQLARSDPNKGPQWVEVQKVWLVTNRHVVLPRVLTTETVPDSFAFHLRRLEGVQLVWEPIRLDRTELLKRARFHQDPTVDVAIIDVLDLLTEKIKTGSQFLQWHGVTKSDLPGQNKIKIEASDDVLVIGYPRGFYDQVNLYPIIKAGIVASKWGAHFEGKPVFLIDAKLFPGSSGSIVVSKPTNVVLDEGQLFTAKERQFAFLGIFSGEPYRQAAPIELETLTIIEKVGFNVGVVWYGSLVEDIIANGVAYQAPATTP